LVSVIDDDTSVLNSLRNLLASAGHRVELFASAESFLESGRLEKTGCLVLDLRMPGMGGAALFSKLIASGQKVPVIILTAVTEGAEREGFLRRGAVAFLPKPFRAADVLAAVRAALAMSAAG
jgi:FixJ family two-component response regulator